jgi:hypothetical protein
MIEMEKSAKDYRKCERDYRTPSCVDGSEVNFNLK